MDVASQVQNLKITDEIIKRFGEPPVDRRKKIKKVAGRIMLSILAIMFVITIFMASAPSREDFFKIKDIEVGFAGLFFLVLFIDLIAQRVAGISYESHLVDYKYMVWQALMQDSSFAAKARTSEDDLLTEEERRRIQEQEDEDYYDDMLYQEAEALRMLEEEEQRIREEEEEYLRIVSHNID